MKFTHFITEVFNVVKELESLKSSVNDSKSKKELTNAIKLAKTDKKANIDQILDILIGVSKNVDKDIKDQIDILIDNL